MPLILGTVDRGEWNTPPAVSLLTLSNKNSLQTSLFPLFSPLPPPIILSIPPNAIPISTCEYTLPHRLPSSPLSTKVMLVRSFSLDPLPNVVHAIIFQRARTIHSQPQPHSTFTLPATVLLVRYPSVRSS